MNLFCSEEAVQKGLELVDSRLYQNLAFGGAVMLKKAMLLHNFLRLQRAPIRLKVGKGTELIPCVSQCEVSRRV